MRKLLALLCLPLAACASLPGTLAHAAMPAIPTSPAAVCDRTMVDEKAGIAVEAAYKAFRTAVESAVDAGIVKGTEAKQLAALDTRIFDITQVEQDAYKTCNAANYFSALDQARQAIRDGYTFLGEAR